MIESTVLRFLQTALPYPVAFTEPDDARGEYVVLERISGSEANHMSSAGIACQSYADTVDRAAEINQEVITAMKTLPAHTPVFRCALSSSYNHTDTRRKKWRYQCVFDLTYMEA